MYSKRPHFHVYIFKSISHRLRAALQNPGPTDSKTEALLSKRRATKANKKDERIENDEAARSVRG